MSATLRVLKTRPPLTSVKQWLKEAQDKGFKNFNAAALCTLSPRGLRPHSRMVLIKSVTPKGLTFFTNSESLKGQDLEKNKHVALTFYWTDWDRQIRIEGVAQKIPRKATIKYWKTRHKHSQAAARLSLQSRPLNSDAKLSDLLKEELKCWGKKSHHLPQSLEWLLHHAILRRILDTKRI